jgi:hypothetical protein
MIRVVHPESGSPIRILIFFPILDPGSRGQKDIGSRIRIRNTDTEMDRVASMLKVCDGRVTGRGEGSRLLDDLQVRMRGRSLRRQQGRRQD